MLGAPARPPRPAATAAGGAGLAEILGRCARGEPGAERALAERCGPRLRALLLRALDGDPGLAEAALPRVLADLRGAAGGFDPARHDAEDWLFARARRLARELARPGAVAAVAAAAPPLPPSAASPPRPPAQATEEPGPGPERHAAAARAGEGSPTRRGREGRPLPPRAPGTRVGAGAGDRGGQRRPLARAAALAAGGLATLGVVAVLGALSGWPPDPPPSPITPPTPPLAPAPVPADVAGDPRPAPALRGTAPDAPPPAPVAAEPSPPPGPPMPEEPPAPAPAAAADPDPTVATVTAGGARVFVHHAGASPEAAALARRMAERLAGAGFAVAAVRPVPFRVGRGSVRYFFPADRDAAARLREAAGPGAGRLADFTHFEPKPTPGTVELWVGDP